MVKTVSTNQTALILSIFTVALKFSALPAVITSFCGNDSTIACLIGLILDFICTILILNVITKIPNKSYFELIGETLSKPVAIIVEVLLLIFFLTKIVLLLLEVHDYFIATLFEDLNPFFFVLCFTLLMMYGFSKNFRTLGRLIQLCFYPMALSVSFTLLYPIADIDVANLLPIFEQGTMPVANAVLHTSVAFGNFMILPILMGKITFEKKSKKKILLYLIPTMLFVFNFFIVFIGSFGEIAINQTLALGELPLHNPYPSTIGKLEWLTIIVWTALLIIQSGLLGLCCKQCIGNIFGINDKKWLPIVTTVLIVGTTLIFHLRLADYLEIVMGTVVSIVFISIEVLTIVLLYVSYILTIRKEKCIVNKEKEKDGDYKKTFSK